MVYTPVYDQAIGFGSATFITLSGVPITSSVSGSSVSLSSESEDILNQGGVLSSPIGRYTKMSKITANFSVTDLNHRIRPYLFGENVEDLAAENVSFITGELKPNITIAIASSTTNLRPGFYYFQISDLSGTKAKLFYIGGEQQAGPSFFSPNRSLLTYKDFALIDEKTYTLGSKLSFPEVSLDLTIKTTPSPAIKQNDAVSFFISKMKGWSSKMPMTVKKPECGFIFTSAEFNRSSETIHAPRCGLSAETIASYSPDEFSAVEFTTEILQHPDYSYTYHLIHTNQSTV